MRALALVSLVVSGLAFCPTAFAQKAPAVPPPSQAEVNQQALQQTQTLLKDQKAREAAMKSDPKAKAADAQVKAIGGSPENTQKIYDLSAQILPQLMQQAGGDPAKMQELVQAAQKDPAKFLQSLTPEQRQAIEALARDISAQKPAAKTPP